MRLILFLYIFMGMYGPNITNILVFTVFMCFISVSEYDTSYENEILLIIGIISAQNNIEYRQSIRETWLTLVYDDPRIKHFFVIGKHPCPIPLADRLDNFSCDPWNASFPKEVIISTGHYTCSETKEEVQEFIFRVQYPIVVHRVSVPQGFTNGSRCEAFDALTRQRLFSASFLSDGGSKPVTPLLLPKGYEIIVKITTTESQKCGMKWDGGGVLTLLHPKNGSLLPAALQYVLNDDKGLRQHISLKQQRRSEWMHKIQMLSENLNQEYDHHQDILFVDVIDVYRNLPIKIFLFLKWLQMNQHAHFLLKVDDDILVNIEAISNELLRLKPNTTNWWWGDFREGWPIHHAGKWKEDLIIRGNIYPPFPCGAGYAFSWDVLDYLCSNESGPIHGKWPQGEDVAIGLWLSQIRLTRHSSKLCDWSCGRKIKNPCNSGELSALQMYQEWSKFRKQYIVDMIES